MFSLEQKHFWFVGKRLYIKSVIDKYLPTKKLKIIDIGCGSGGTTVFFKKYGGVVGLEKNPVAVGLAKKRGLCVVQSGAQALPFPDQSFDLALLLDVLYHKNITHKEKVIKEAKRVLKPDGFLLITDSAFSFLWGTHDRLLEGNKRFTIPELSSLLTKDGLILKSSYLYFVFFPLVFLRRAVIDKIFSSSQSDVFPLNRIVNLFLIKLITVVAWLLKYVPFPIGSSLLIFAKKGSNSLQNRQ